MVGAVGMTELSKDNLCYQCRWAKFQDESLTICENGASDFYKMNINKEEIKLCYDVFYHDDDLNEFKNDTYDDGGLF